MPIEKSQKRHTRTSKTGKVFTAGSGTKIDKRTNEEIKRDIDRNPVKYSKYFNFYCRKCFGDERSLCFKTIGCLVSSGNAGTL